MDEQLWKAAIEAQFVMGHCVPAAHVATDRTTITGWSWDVDQVRQHLSVPLTALWEESILELEMQGLASFCMSVAPVTWDAQGQEQEIPGWQDEPRERWGSVGIHPQGVLRLAKRHGRPMSDWRNRPRCSLIGNSCRLRVKRGCGPGGTRRSGSGNGRSEPSSAKPGWRRKRRKMVTDVTHLTLIGRRERDPIPRFVNHYASSGTPYASFTLVGSELGQDGKEHATTLIPCEVWGKKAEAASVCEAGQLVLFEGKLKKRQKGEQWALIVNGFEVTPIIAAVPALTGSQ